jgi:DNA polymerase-4
MTRRIAHLDMDAFYASVELLRYPQLKGQPVVIGGRRRRGAGEAADTGQFARLLDYVGRGVATTATYEARAFGVNSAMGLMKAAKLAPDAILLPADFEEYGRYSRLFKGAVAAIAPCIEDRGIDEIYIDLTDVPGETIPLAQSIKDNVRRATNLSCSIGIAPNKLLAKLASELDKPNGLTVIGAEDIARRIWPLAVRKVNGIGPRANAKLETLGIRTIGDLAAADPAVLIERFGASYGAWLHEAAHGRDERPIVTVREPKSISRETTFERDLHPRGDREALSKVLLTLCERVAGDLQRKGVRGKTISVKLRYDDFRTVTRDHTIDPATEDAEVIRAAARSCLKRVPLDRRLRLLGVRVGTLVSVDAPVVAPGAGKSGKPDRRKVDPNLPLFDEEDVV